MKKALITGITGQDGSYLAELLLEKGYEVHGIIRRSSSFNTQRIDHVYQDPHTPGCRLFLHFADLNDASSLNYLLKKLRPDEIYNLGAGFEITIRELVPLVARLCRFEGEIVWDATKPDGQPRRMLDTSKALREFGWKARIGFEDGLRETVEWYEKERENVK